MYILFRQRGQKTIPYPAARPRIAQIREYPPGEKKTLVRFHATAVEFIQRTCAVYFRGNLFPTALSAPAVAICLKCLRSKTNNCCLFERLFKVKKNSVFLSGISLLVLEIFTLLYYAKEESGDVINSSS